MGDHLEWNMHSHNGGVWKIFDKKGKRLGAADKDLVIFKD
ncbi:hypothetical protein AO382_2109 [Moraxella catarrhalis]|uniref:Uncharacterized protein n=1 Tax=Moraxella catarrhalis TaxID=480 RepID=A0A7Z1A310_MORCA|nr:hypothetical protein AO382_2109 [Moraxella catarrhalis]